MDSLRVFRRALLFGVILTAPAAAADLRLVPEGVQAPPVDPEKRLMEKKAPDVQTLLDRATAAVREHRWEDLLAMFEAENRRGQDSMGIGGPQYLAEAFGLHDVKNSLPGDVRERSTLDQIQEISIDRKSARPPAKAGELAEYSGSVTLGDGTKLMARVYVLRTVGGYLLTAPSG